MNPGSYEGTFERASLTETRNGTPCLETYWRVENAVIYAPVYLSDAAFETSKKKLEAAGFNGDFENPEFAGEARLTMRVEEYNGEEREKWDLAWGGNEPAGKSVVARVKQLWQTSTPVSTPKPTGRPTRPIEAPPQKTVTPDDVWNAFADQHADLDGQALADAWFEYLQTVVGKTEGLTREDCLTVIRALEIPF